MHARNDNLPQVAGSIYKFFFFAFQIAAKIGGDGVNPPPPTNEFAYGGQKRPLEDGGKFPFNLKSSGTLLNQ